MRRMGGTGKHKKASPPAEAGRGDAAADVLLPRMYLRARFDSILYWRDACAPQSHPQHGSVTAGSAWVQVAACFWRSPWIIGYQTRTALWMVGMEVLVEELGGKPVGAKLVGTLGEAVAFVVEDDILHLTSE